MKSNDTRETEYLLVGGGLQNCLLALFLLHRHPSINLTLVESQSQLGGNHTWSYHQSDIPPAYRAALAPVRPYQWDRYEVHFPEFSREVPSGYATILSTQMHEAVRDALQAAPNGQLLVDTAVRELRADQATLDNGEVICATHVFDGRGLSRDAEIPSGYQKFVGLEFLLDRPSPFQNPVIMDARVPQVDGFRFFYLLPLAADRILVEDTRFSSDPTLNLDVLHNEVMGYAKEQGLTIREVVRSESGVLPMPYAMPDAWPDQMPLEVGYRGNFFHPATGYSVPVAARLAAFVADCAPDSPLESGWATFLAAHQRQFRFATFLNRLQFTAYRPGDRYNILERFYRQPEETIERFYRLELTTADMARQFAGRPPRGFSLRQLLQGAPLS